MTDDNKNDLIDQLTGLLGRWVTRGRTKDYDACMTTVAAHIAPETVVKAPEGRMPAADPRSGLPGMDHYLALLALPGKIVGHNFLGYDARCLVKRLNAKIDFGKICDTLTASRLARPFRPIVRRALSQQP